MASPVADNGLVGSDVHVGGERVEVTEEMLAGFFLAKYPDYVENVPVVVVESTRQSPKGRGSGWRDKPATLRLLVPDEVVLNMRGDEAKRDWYVMLRVRREGLDKLEEDRNRRIITPDNPLVK